MQRAAALALTYRDDQVNMTAALMARGLNPSIRLVIRMFNRERGRHLERLLDRAAAEFTGGGDDDPRPDMRRGVRGQGGPRAGTAPRRAPTPQGPTASRRTG
ncbi:hypothetical protein AB0M86_46965, partial [Streptomyces sp. NPDC051639]